MNLKVQLLPNFYVLFWQILELEYGMETLEYLKSIQNTVGLGILHTAGV